ncbi:hypothetical protein [Xanthomonas campestris]|uniref:hypothetical protein n=1 Tax=Xanthomonas campestris TaxID=339 RepID=UPI001E3F4559|nr:hypothetical protein [Xanthomonas campestris]MCC5064156.1 hypothetical protein [Xanthomonas campestris pv. raphani]MEA9890064.1 hypothetical protein [Xanthomonas campestris pv. raphani]MEA9975252.1 hypothetical protein [Xanthomonas campestris pv. raphani]
MLRITSAIPAAVRAGALRVEEMASPSVNCVYLATGYPLKRFTEQERNLVMRSTSLLTEAERVGLKVNGTQHVVVRNEPYMLKDGRSELHKSLQGISGGGLFLLHGISVDVAPPIMDTLTLRLVASVVEHRKKTMTGPASLICTSVGCHLFLADQIIDGEMSPSVGVPSGARAVQADYPCRITASALRLGVITAEEGRYQVIFGRLIRSLLCCASLISNVKWQAG